MKVHRRAATGAAVAALALLAGCGQGSSSLTAPDTGTTTAPSGSPGTPSSGAVRLSEAAAGRTVQVHPGDRIVLTLHNTYWRIGPADGRVLSQIGTQQDSPAPSGTCRPGVGCGTVRASFVAATSGSTTLTASRTTCGEAMACPPGQGRYVTRVIVSQPD